MKIMRKDDYKNYDVIDLIKETKENNDLLDHIIKNELLPSFQSKSSLLDNDKTVSHKTVAQYRKCAETLINRYKKIILNQEFYYSNMAEYYVYIKSKFKINTWILYKSALMYHLNICENTEDVEIAKKIILSDENKSHEQIEEYKINIKTKFFDQKDWFKMLNYFSLQSSNYHKLSVLWLYSSILTALRPIEWQATNFLDNKLYVMNAKSTNGRSTGAIRILNLKNMPLWQIEIIKKMSIVGKKLVEDGSFLEAKKKVSQCIYVANKEIWPKRKTHYTLYSCRHQAISNWKAIMPIQHVSALVGHNVTSTTISHYGKKRDSWDKRKIYNPPMAEKISNTKLTIKKKKQITIENEKSNE